MTKRYTVIDGEIIAVRTGGKTYQVVPDPLGSVVALLETPSKVSDTFSYFAYGDQRARTGTTPMPFRFVGTYGYYYDPTGMYYVRARSYRQNLGRWLTVDPLWPLTLEFSYVDNNPTSFTDRLGLIIGEPKDWCGGISPSESVSIWRRLCNRIQDTKHFGRAIACLGSLSVSNNVNQNCLIKIDWFKSVFLGMKNLCGSTVGVELINAKKGCDEVCDKVPTLLGYQDSRLGTRCKVTICCENIQPRSYPGRTNPGTYEHTLCHETMHCLGVDHWSPGGTNSCNSLFCCCLENAYNKQKWKKCNNQVLWRSET